MNKKPFPIVAALVAVVALSSLYLNSLIVSSAPSQAAEAPSEFSAERYLRDVTYLAKDDMKGRGNGTPELDLAADYIAARFRDLGLQPSGENGSYFQQFSLTTGVELGDRNTLEIGGTSLKINQEFVPINFSPAAEADAPAVFAGYGITAPELHYDDYQGIDASGKVVIVMRHEPQEMDEKSAFNGNQFTNHATFINKAINARQHGAKGIIFITDPNAHASEKDEVGEATRGSESENVGIPAFHALRAPITALLERNGRNLSAIQTQIDADLRPQSFDIPQTRIRLSTDIRRIQKPVRNVIAALPGSDPVLKDEWVVIGAHYDHLGTGDRHSLAPSLVGQIHHGADDNASGTSGVLELARVISQNKQNFKRSVLFMTFAGEELGLLGSAHFVANPTVPLANIVGMLNLDMVGRLTNNRLFIGGVGTSPGFRAAIEEANKSVGLNLDYSDSGYGGSDHMSFNLKRIPVLFFFSGLHTDYHKPSDTYDKINTDGALKVLSLAFSMARQIANEESRPQYTQVSQPRAPSGGGGGGYGAYFGSVPDFRDDVTGVLFADVTPNSPAAKAGLQAGDLMTAFDGKAIQNLYDFTFALQSKKPGDVVRVVVKRGNADVAVDVTLEARR